ncbi:MAG: hypothetical protein JRE81_00960 [Deltaproteobacteria bacterium]|jgi:hypothetical protein|nr:hypothetical protein [Deltaproteobacteria bacterium]
MRIVEAVCSRFQWVFVSSIVVIIAACSSSGSGGEGEGSPESVDDSLDRLGVDAGLSWGGSNSTVYRGTVGSINVADFPSNVYNFGLFTYLYNFGNPEAQQFEVINYWVERVE